MKETNRSFSKRMSRRILIALTLTIAFVAILVITVSCIALRKMSIGYFLSELQIANEWIEKGLYGAQVASANTVDKLSAQLDSPEHVFGVLEDCLEPNDPYIIGFGAAFEPYYFPGQGKWFEAYVHRMDDRIDAHQAGGEQHDYFNLEWYAETLQADKDYWSDPYFNEPGSLEPVCTYFQPVIDPEGRRVGVLGTDISLDWIYSHLGTIDNKVNEYLPLKSMKAGREGNGDLRAYNIIFDSKGIYIYHPDKQKILHDSFYDDIRQTSDDRYIRLIQALADQRKDWQVIKYDGKVSYIFFTNYIKNTGWKNAIIIPAKGFAIPIIVNLAILLLIIALGLHIAYRVSRLSIQRATEPLRLLADSADEVAKGNFLAPLPELKYGDEVHQLRNSFSNMQASLIHYIDELKTTTAEKAAIESEINIAREIQMSRIPTDFPHRADIDVYGCMTPAKTVGGDLYDFFVRDHAFVFCIGDVSGKGVPAALLMMVTKSLFRAYASDGSSPDRIVAQMNRDLCENNDSCMFVTLIVGVLDLKSRQLRYCNAGHEAPVLIRTEVSTLPVNPIPPVGAFEETAYRMQMVDLEPQSTLLFFTDGLSEAMNAENEMFGRERLLEVAELAAEAQQTSPKALIERMTGAVHEFVGDTEQSDDLTMLCLRI